MVPRRRLSCNCGKKWLYSDNITRFLSGITFAIYVILVTILFSFAYSFGLPVYLYWILLLSTVMYGAPLGLTRGMARHVMQRGLQTFLTGLSNDPNIGENDRGR